VGRKEKKWSSGKERALGKKLRVTPRKKKKSHTAAGGKKRPTRRGGHLKVTEKGGVRSVRKLGSVTTKKKTEKEQLWMQRVPNSPRGEGFWGHRGKPTFEVERRFFERDLPKEPRDKNKKGEGRKKKKTAVTKEKKNRPTKGVPESIGDSEKGGEKPKGRRPLRRKKGRPAPRKGKKKKPRQKMEET